MEKNLSYYLAFLMRAFFALLFAAGVLLGSVFNYGHRSYLIAFIASALFVILIASRKFGFPGLLERLFMRINRAGKLKTALILSLFCFAVNLACVMHYTIVPRVDFETFYEQAGAVCSGSPLMPLYLALFPHVFGYAWIMGHAMLIIGESVRAITVLNVCLTTVTGLLIFLMCEHWFDLPTAALAFFLWSVCPSKMLYNGMVLSEPLYTCTLMVFFFCVMQQEKGLGKYDSRFRSAVVSIGLGAVAAVSLFVTNVLRPIAAVMVIAFFIWLFLLRGKHENFLREWSEWLLFSSVMLIGFTLMWNTWLDYEAFRFHEDPATLPAYSIYVGLDPDSEGSFSEPDMDMLMNYRYNQENGSAVWAQEQMMQQVKELLSSGKVKPLNLLLKKLPKFYGSDEGGAFYAAADISSGEYRFWSIASNVFYYVCALFCLIGTRHRIERADSFSALMLPLFATGLTLAHMIVEVAGRYKYCLIPIIIVLAAKEFVEILSHKTDKNQHRAENAWFEPII